MHKAGPGREGAFHWPELRSFWEFKVKDDTVGTSTPTVEAPATNPANANSKQRAEPKAPTRESLPRSGKAISNPEAVSAGNKRPSEDPGSLGLPPKRLRTENVDPKIQCASYALELLSNGGLRNHVIAVLVSRNSLELLYYDRSLVLKSQPLDFTEDTTSFLAILFGFGNLTPTQWGDPASTLLKAPTVATFSDDYKAMYFGYVLTLSEGWQLQLGNVIFRAHGIIGRGTVVVGAKVVASPLPNFVSKRVVVKWSWVATTRKEEGYIVKKAVEYADANRPSMRHHLPNIYHYQELPEQTPQCQKFLLANFKDAYEERVLRIVVQEELHPITDLTDATELAEAFKQIFECYRWLYEGPKIMHRDVSISNLMFQRIDGKLYGILNDFDLAAFHDGSVPSTSKQRTGTKPYMASDLLTHPPPKHYYRHDLESFLYVLAFLTCDIRAPNSTLGTWIDLGMAALQDAKGFLLASKGFPPQKPAFEGFDFWITLLRRLFSEGISKRTRHKDDDFFARRTGALPPLDFDHETLGGCVTFATFAAVLENPLLQPA
ncbi:hypothetical protein B0H10DRAFT_904714 [Mycena sp. CBHHK59/15]|nr:hypothetical protein B0H10DRAFT_904714 [Mycena sp. CBHHK59/15]